MAHHRTTALRNQISIAVKFWPQCKKNKTPHSNEWGAYYLYPICRCGYASNLSVTLYLTLALDSNFSLNCSFLSHK